jgi:hypothetical protein
VGKLKKKKKTKINIIIKKSPPFDSRPTMILHNGGLPEAGQAIEMES